MKALIDPKYSALELWTVFAIVLAMSAGGIIYKCAYSQQKNCTIEQTAKTCE